MHKNWSGILIFPHSTVGTVPTDVELFPRRTTDHSEEAYLMQHLVFDDPYDTALYYAARQMFAEEIAYVKQWKNVEV